MSLVKVSGNASGTGTLTIAAPNTNSDYTLTLPQATGTFNISGVANEVPAGTVSAPSIYSTGDTNTGIFFPAADTIAFTEGGSEAMRIDSNGRWMVNVTTALNGGTARGSLVFNGAVEQGLFIATSGANNGQCMGFNYNISTNVGSINITSGATSYSTSSDYRLKENIAPMTGALITVAKLKPVTYKWKLNGETTQGFIAHELQEVVPECVVGEKDAVDAEGNPKYQGIDTSFLVATLTAAIQEQQAIITQLQADVAELKGTTA